MVLGGFAGTWLATRSAEIHWTRAALVPGGVVFVIAIAYLLIARDRTAEPSRATEAAAAKAEPGALVITHSLVAIAAMYSCVKMTRYAFLFWLPLYMTEHLRYPNAQAGYASSAYELIGIAGALTAGYLSERLRGDRFGVAAVMMVILALLCATYAQASAAGLEMNLLWIGLIGFFTFGPDTLMAGSALQDIVPARSIGSAAGFVNGTGSLGQVISPIVVAYVSQHAGWPALFGGLSVVVALGALALVPAWMIRAAARRNGEKGGESAA